MCFKDDASETETNAFLINSLKVVGIISLLVKEGSVYNTFLTTSNCFNLYPCFSTRDNIWK